MKKTLGLRVDADEEFAGLDVAEHGTSGYGVETAVVALGLTQGYYNIEEFCVENEVVVFLNVPPV